jgi:hypothetical protein
VEGQSRTTKLKQWAFSSLDYLNPTNAQWVGDTTIIKIVLAFRPTCIAAAVDWAELAIWITVEIAKESWQQSLEQLAMKTTAIAASLPQMRSWSCLPERLADFVSLMKLRVTLLALFTAIVGPAIAPAHLDLWRGSVAIFAIGTGAGPGGVLNMWYDADIDAVMTRTGRRPIARGKISRPDALVFGLVLAGASVASSRSRSTSKRRYSSPLRPSSVSLCTRYA